MPGIRFLHLKALRKSPWKFITVPYSLVYTAHFFHGGEYQKSGVRLIYEYSKTRHLFLGHTERNVTAIHFRR